MKRLIAAVFVLMVPAAFAAEGEITFSPAKVDLGDRASLQRGARLFVNYCLSCHSARYMRYNRVGRDLGLTDKQVEDNLMFAADKVGETMTVAMSEEDAKGWLGNAPPDLSVIARARGADWLNTFLLGFYEDAGPTRPFGVNNLVFKDLAMPFVLEDLQGLQALKAAKEDGGAGGHGEARVSDLLELETPGTMSPAQYGRAVGDLVNFLVYMGEPAKLVRYRIGTWVLLFLFIFFLVSRSLYKAYWKDIH